MDRTAGVDFLDSHSHYSSDSFSYRGPSSSGEWVPPPRPPTHASLNSMVEDLMRTTQREVEAFEERLEVLEEEKNTIKSMISTYADHVSNVLDVEHKMYVLDLRMQAVELGVQGLDTRFQVMEKDVSEIKSDIKLILAHLNIKPLNHEPAPEPATVTPTLVVEQPTSTTLPRTISEPNLPPPRISPVVQQSERQNLFSRSLPSLPEPARELEEEMTNLTKGMLKLRGNFSLFLRKSMANLRQ